MFNFISKLYQSIIARDQLVKVFSERNGINHTVHSAVIGYDQFENQMGALQDSRAYRKIALKAEHKAKWNQLPEQFFFNNYGTRDLVESKTPIVRSEQQSLLTMALTLVEILLKALINAFDNQPPPLKSSLIPDFNLTARLLPAPTPTSA